jgi:phage terminase large subunit-like protein
VTDEDDVVPIKPIHAARLIDHLDRGTIDDAGVKEVRFDWSLWARPSQLPPDGDWRVWLLLAGRGFGKTRSGAEWVRAQAESGAAARIALVAPTARDARLVMVEGQSGLLAIAPDAARPVFEPSKRQLTWPNGAIATLFSADEPDRLRGPQFDAAWCDELAAWSLVGEDQGRQQIASPARGRLAKQKSRPGLPFSARDSGASGR